MDVRSQAGQPLPAGGIWVGHRCLISMGQWKTHTVHPPWTHRIEWDVLGGVCPPLDTLSYVEWPLQPFRTKAMVICLGADLGPWEGEVWSQSSPQGRVKDEVTRDPDPAQDKGQIQFRARGVLLVGACSQSTLGVQAAAGRGCSGWWGSCRRFSCQEADQLHEYFIREQT